MPSREYFTIAISKDNLIVSSVQADTILTSFIIIRLKSCIGNRPASNISISSAASMQITIAINSKVARTIFNTWFREINNHSITRKISGNIFRQSSRFIVSISIKIITTVDRSRTSIAGTRINNNLTATSRDTKDRSTSFRTQK